MLTSSELHQLVLDLNGTKVLSVYLDTRPTNPAMRHAWRATLTTGLREARARITDEREREEFDRAAALLAAPFPGPGGAWGPPGWVAFVSATERIYTGDLPVQPSPLVVWRDGPVVTPYLRALKQHRPVIVALVDSRSARLFRYIARQVEPLDELTAPSSDEVPGVERITARPAGATTLPAARGAVGTDEAQRQRQVAFQRLAASVSKRIEELVGDGWVVIGGTKEWAHLAEDALPSYLRRRTLVLTSLAHDAGTHEIANAAERAATELRAAAGSHLVDQLVDDAGPGGRAALNVPAVQRALLARAVDELILSPAFIRSNEDLAEDLVRAALESGAEVEVASADAGDRLDRAASGIAARLRFAIDEPVKATGERAAPHELRS